MNDSQLLEILFALSFDWIFQSNTYESYGKISLESKKLNAIRSTWTAKWIFECFPLIVSYAHCVSNLILIQMTKLSFYGMRITQHQLNIRIISKFMISRKDQNSSVQHVLLHTARETTAVSGSVNTRLEWEVVRLQRPFESGYFVLERRIEYYLIWAFLPSGMCVIVSMAGFWIKLTASPARNRFISKPFDMVHLNKNNRPKE